jgi:hypothetical protein
MDLLLAFGAGLALAAACGLRVFAPLFVLGLAARFGGAPLGANFGWLAATPALVTLGVATVVEIAAYHVPWLDHALDAIATPAAVLAGTVVVAGSLAHLPPWLGWSLGLVGGGGIAGLTQGATVLLRLKSLALTGGAGNPVVSTGEGIGAIGLSLLAILVPLVAITLVVLMLVGVFALAHRLAFGRHVRAAAPPA